VLIEDFVFDRRQGSIPTDDVLKFLLSIFKLNNVFAACRLFFQRFLPLLRALSNIAPPWPGQVIKGQFPLIPKVRILFMPATDLQ
jgi:hypothetical protein